MSWELPEDAKDVTFKLSRKLWDLVKTHAGYEDITVQELMDCLLRYHFSALLGQAEVAVGVITVGLERNGS